MITKEEMIALRKAKAEIDERYDKARDETFAQLYDKMCEDHRGYYSSELADITGLSKSSVTRRLRHNLNFEQKTRPIYKKYVELDRDGVPMMDKIHQRTYIGKVYKVREDSSIMREYNRKHNPTVPDTTEERKPPMVAASKVGKTIGGAMVKALIEKYNG